MNSLVKKILFLVAIILVSFLSIRYEYIIFKKSLTVDIFKSKLPMYSVVGMVEKNSQIKTDNSNEGYLAYGPYVSLKEGKYSVRYKLLLNSFNNNNQSIGYCDIDIENHPKIAFRKNLTISDFKNQNPQEIQIDFYIPGGLPKVQFRVYQYSGNNISLTDLLFTQNSYKIKDFILDNYGTLRIKTFYIFGILILFFLYIKLIFKSGNNSLIKHSVFTTIIIIISGLVMSAIWQNKNFSNFVRKDYYDMWKVFYAPLWVSLVFIFFNFLYLINNRFGFSEKIEKYLKYDKFSLLIIPIFILTELFYKNFNTQFVLGNFYLSTLIIKGLIYFSFLWQNIKDEENVEVSKGIKWSIFLSIFTIYLLITPWVNACFYADGDEPRNLIITQSLIKDGDRDISNNLESEDNLSYHSSLKSYGQNWKSFISGISPSFTIILIPGFVLGGRFAISLLMNIFGALLLLNIFQIIFHLTKSNSSSFLAMIIGAFSLPIGIYSFLAYPEIIAALIVTYIIRKLLLQEYNLIDIITMFLLAILLTIIKERYLILTLSLFISIIISIKKNKKVLLNFVLLFIIFGVLLFFYDKYLIGFDIISKISNYYKPILQKFKYIITVGDFGLMLDQERGLLMHAPVYIFSFLGIISLLKTNKKIVLLLLLLFLPYYNLISKGPDWSSLGGSPATRYIVTIIPILIIFYGVFLNHCRRLWLKLVNYFAIAWSFVMYYILILFPQYRTHSPSDLTGRNEILDRLYSVRLFPDLTPLFPSFLKIFDTTYHLTILFIIIFIVLLIYYKKQENVIEEKYDKKKVLKITAVIISIFISFLVLGKFSYYKYQVFEVENYYTGGGMLWQEGLLLKGKGYFSLIKVALRKSEEIKIKLIVKGDIPKDLPEISIEIGNNKYKEKIGKIKIESRNWKEYSILYKTEEGGLKPFWFIYDNYTEGKDVLIDKIIFSSIEKKSWLGFINYQLGRIDRRLGLIDYAYIRFEKAAKLGYKIEKK